MDRLAFNFDIHGVRGSIPTVTDYGEFKRRRGCNPALHERLEREALEAIAEADPEPEIPESEPPEQEPHEVVGYYKLKALIEKATNTEDLADAEDMLRDFEGTSDQHEELVRLVAARRHKLMQTERG
jgi:hypothetical protein